MPGWALVRTYDERLTAPIGLWAAVWVGSLVLAVSFYAALGPVFGLLALAVPGVHCPCCWPGRLRWSGSRTGISRPARPASRCPRSARPRR